MAEDRLSVFASPMVRRAVMAEDRSSVFASPTARPASMAEDQSSVFSLILRSIAGPHRVHQSRAEAPLELGEGPGERRLGETRQVALVGDGGGTRADAAAHCSCVTRITMGRPAFPVNAGTT
jgi:hypothetical protein